MLEEEKIAREEAIACLRAWLASPAGQAEEARTAAIIAENSTAYRRMRELSPEFWTVRFTISKEAACP